MCDLINDLVTIWDDSVQLLKSLQTFIVIIKSLINQPKVVNGLNAVSFDTDGFEEELLGSIEIFVVVKTVTLVH